MDHNNDRFKIPQQKFRTPEDASTWAVILTSRFWIDQYENMLEIENSSNQLKPEGALNSNVSCSSPQNWNSEYQATRQKDEVARFADILKQTQKPCLFGNSVNTTS